MTRLLRATAVVLLVVSSIVLAERGAAAATTTVCATGCDHSSIQEAIDGSTPGAVLSLAAEPFDGFVVDRAITILGASFAQPSGARTTIGAPVVITAGPVRLGALELGDTVTAASAVPLVEITGGSLQDAVEVDGAERLVLRDVAISARVSVHDVGVTEVAGSTFGGAGLIELDDVGSAWVHDNDGLSTTSLVRARGVTSLDVVDNAFSRAGGPTVHLLGDVQGQVRRNAIANGQAEGVLVGRVEGAGPNDVSIRSNAIAAVRGIVVDEDAQTDASAFWNDLSATTEAGVVNHDADFELDATCNWWGVPNGPSVPGVDTGGALAVGLLDVEPWASEADDAAELCRGLPRIMIDELPAEVPEGDDAHEVPLTFRLVAGPVHRTVNLAWRTDGPLDDGECSGGTCAAATSGQDHEAASGILTFPAGTETQQASITVLGDAVAELPEVIRIGGGGALGGDACFGDGPYGSPSDLSNCDHVDFFSLTLVNDDDQPPAATVSATAGSRAEGDGGTRNLPVTFTLSSPQPTLVQVTYETADGTALASDGDYQPRTGLMGFAPGQTTATLNFKVVGDTRSEDDETFLVRLLGATGGVGIATPEVVATILDDDAPRLSATVDPVLEGDSATTTVPVTFHLSRASTTPIRVSFSTEAATAAASDFVARSGVLGFAPGQTTATLHLQVRGDRLVEAHEELALRLSDPQGVVVDASPILIGIDDDDVDKPRITWQQGSVVEPDSGTRSLPVTFTLSAPQATLIQLPFATGAYGGPEPKATAGVDYQIRSGLVGFAPGQTTATINLKVIGDVLVEGEELFQLTLSSPSAIAAIADDHVPLVITDDDVA